MRVVFMGTPQFAVPSLKGLVEAGYEVAGVFCQPDRPAGRGGRLTVCPVKEYALSQGIQVRQVERIRRPEGLEALKDLRPDICVTAAFGQILSRENLAVPPLGTVNVHASLLPRHRGAAPINWAILMGDQTTGVTTMFTDPGLDTGDMLIKRETPILPGETAGELTQRLSLLGKEVLLDTLSAIAKGDCRPTPQDPAQASYEPMLDKALGRMDFDENAQALERKVRALNPWPGAWTDMPGGVLKIWSARPLTKEFPGLPGQVVVSGPREGLVVKCGRGALELTEIQAPGAKRMQARAYLMGKTLPVGTVLHG